MLAREAEEVDEEAERDRGCDRKEDSAAPARVVRTTFLGRGENSSSRATTAPPGASPEGRSPVASEIPNGITAPQAATGATTLIVPTASAL